jgi:LysR family glycine cleavage system transcriptional activator
MRRQLPPLNAVRAFEASARHLSFTRAADELAVTQAAVSQHVRRLEDWLQVKLFRRHEGRLELTQAGHVYIHPLTQAFDQIADATARIRPGARHGLLSVTTTPPFATKWLVPRLSRFSAEHPAIDVRLTTSNRLVDFDQDGIDVAVRLGPGDWPGLEAEKLFDEEVFPVCSPALMDGEHPLRAPQDLQFHTLLHDDSLVHWRYWLRLAEVNEVEWTRGPRFSDSANLLDAAVAGQGVALGQRVLAALDLAQGRLVKPFGLVVRNAYGFHVAVKPGGMDRPAVRAFRDWLFAEAAAMDRFDDGDRVVDFGPLG